MGGKSTKQKSSGDSPAFQCKLCMENTTENSKLSKCDCTFCTKVMVLNYSRFQSFKIVAFFSVHGSVFGARNQRWKIRNWMPRNQLQERQDHSWRSEKNRCSRTLPKVHQLGQSFIWLFERESETVYQTRMQ